MNTKLIAWLTGILTLSLACFAFILSFNALTDLAAKHGVSIPPLFPFVVEFAVVIFSLNALHRSITQQKAYWQWTLIILSSLLAGIFNIAHAEQDILSKAMAAMPSLFLLLSFESFLSLVKYSVTRQNIVSSLATLVAQYETLQATLHNTEQQIAKSSERLEAIKAETKSALFQQNAKSIADLNAARQEKIDNRRNQVLLMLQEEMSHEEIAKELGFSIRTIRNDIKQLNGKVG